MSISSQPKSSLTPEPFPLSDFATTQWSVVLAAGDLKNEHAQAALSQLCQTYWMPLYAYARRQVHDVHDAQDLTQAFFSVLLEKNYVGSATPERGRFRAYLLTSLKHFMSKQWQKSRAQKRGGGTLPISIDFVLADSTLNIEPASRLTAEQIYEQQWGITLLGNVMDRLATEFKQNGKFRTFDVLRCFLIGDHVGSTYAMAATELGTTEAAAKQAASRMRKRYRELLRDEIGQTVACPEEVDAEIRNLFTVLAL